MKSLPIRFTSGALLAAASLSVSAQEARPTPSANLTLLTGPNLLSPPTRPIESASISSEIIFPGNKTPAAKETWQARRDAAEARLRMLQAEREAAMKRRQEALERLKAPTPSPTQSRPATPPAATPPAVLATPPTTP